MTQTITIYIRIVTKRFQLTHERKHDYVGYNRYIQEGMHVWKRGHSCMTFGLKGVVKLTNIQLLFITTHVLRLYHILLQKHNVEKQFIAKGKCEKHASCASYMISQNWVHILTVWCRSSMKKSYVFDDKDVNVIMSLFISVLGREVDSWFWCIADGKMTVVMLSCMWLFT